MTRALAWSLLCTLAVAVALPRAAEAGPWTRPAGRFYLGATYSTIDANRFYSLDGKLVDFGLDEQGERIRYRQHAVGFYSEFGLADRWLTMTFEGQLYRRSGLEKKGNFEGPGDIRFGLWSGLPTAPVRLTAAVLLGVPTGEASPRTGLVGDEEALQIARALPTGDGELDVEGRLSLGHSFGGGRRWPLVHYLVAELGYWLRTNQFSDAVVYKAELGIKLPWTFVDRFWLILRFYGTESLASTAELQRNTTPNATGLGNGVTYMVVGGELYGRIWKGLGASFAIDKALRARLLPGAAAPRFSISWEY